MGEEEDGKVLPPAEDGTLPPRPPAGGDARCPSTDGMVELGSVSLSALALGRARDDDGGDDGGRGGDDCSDASSCDDPFGDLGGGDVPSPSPGTPSLNLLGRRYSLPADAREVDSARRSLCYLTYRSGLAVPLVPYPGGPAPSLSALGGALRGVAGLSEALGAGAVGGGGGRGMTTDAGWGCMLRSVQMMAAEAVRRHYRADARERGRAERSSGNGSSGGGDPARRGGGDGIEHHRLAWDQLDDPLEVERIARWFADLPDRADSLRGDSDSDSDPERGDGGERRPEEEEYGTGGLDRHWYSLHCLVAAGIGLGVLPGEWYGPNDACHAVRELNEVHCGSRSGASPAGGTGGPDVFRVHVAAGGAVYLDEVEGIMTGGRGGRGEGEATAAVSSGGDGEAGGETDPLRAFLREEEDRRNNGPAEERPGWDTSLLLLVPLRLGLESIDPDVYGRPLAALLGLPQSVGMVGGTPRHALWFYGADDGGRWYGLDPHVVQPAPRGTLAPAAAGRDGRWRADLTDAYLRSLRADGPAGPRHPNNHRPLPLSGLDPSVALGFYVRDRDDMDSLAAGIGGVGGGAGVIAVEGGRPAYARGEGQDAYDVDGFSMRSDEGRDDDDDDDFVLV